MLIRETGTLECVLEAGERKKNRNKNHTEPFDGIK